MSESDVSEKRGAALPGSQCPQHAASLTPCHLSPCHRHRPGSELLAVTKAIIHFLMGYTFLPQMPLLFHRTAPTALTSPKSIQGIVGGVVCPVGPSGCHCWCWDGHVHGNVAGAWLHHAASELDGSVCLDHFAKCNNLANRSWPLPDPVVPPTFGSPWALAPSGKAHRRGKRFGLWCLSRRPSIWACTKRSSNWRLYAFSHAWTLRTLTLSTILLTRNPCLDMLTRCLREVFGWDFHAQRCSGTLRTRLFWLQQHPASSRFGRRRQRRWGCATSFQNEVLPSSLRGFVSLPIAGMVSLWAALWANEWAEGDSWALRMPYAFLTQIPNHRLGQLRQYSNISDWRCIWWMVFWTSNVAKVSVLSMWQFTRFVLDHLNWQTNVTMINDDETTWICIQVRDMIWDNPTARLPLSSLHFWDYTLRLCAMKRVCNDINDRLKLHTTK